MKSFVAAALLLALQAAPGRAAGAPAPRRVAVAAAADLRFALEAIVPEFRRAHPDIDVEVTYGSSGVLYAQLANHAPFDLFLSADVAYPRRLADQGLTRTDSLFTYAVGHLVIWTPVRAGIDVERLGFGALELPTVAHVSIANPEVAPYGRAAIAALESARLLDRVKPKLVYAENVGQALQFVQSGAAQAGLVALSLAVAPGLSASGRYWLIPPAMYPKVEQGGVVLARAADAAAAMTFRAFLLSDAGRELLKRFGFYVEP